MAGEIADRTRTRPPAPDEQRQLADRDEHVHLQGPRRRPQAGQAVTVRPQVQAAVGLGEADQGRGRDQGDQG